MTFSNFLFKKICLASHWFIIKIVLKLNYNFKDTFLLKYSFTLAQAILLQILKITPGLIFPSPDILTTCFEYIHQYVSEVFR